MLRQRRCHNCNEWFWAYGEQRFCCRACYNEYRRRMKERREKKKCPSCGKEMERYDKHTYKCKCGASKYIGRQFKPTKRGEKKK